MTRTEEAIQQSIQTKEKLLQDAELLNRVEVVIEQCVASLKDGKKVLFCGNGGSAADAQHLAAELSGRFYFDRDPLPSEALHVNTSYLTAVANDYSYDLIYSRLVHAQGVKGDVLIGLSTSGNSKNVVAATQAAKELGMITVGLTGSGGGTLKDVCEHWLPVPSTDVARIQESHMLLGHVICEQIESRYFPRPSA